MRLLKRVLLSTTLFLRGTFAAEFDGTQSLDHVSLAQKYIDIRADNEKVKKMVFFKTLKKASGGELFFADLKESSDLLTQFKALRDYFYDNTAKVAAFKATEAEKEEEIETLRQKLEKAESAKGEAESRYVKVNETLQKATAAEKKAIEHANELRKSLLDSSNSLVLKENELTKEQEAKEFIEEQKKHLREKLLGYDREYKALESYLERYKVENERLNTELTVSKGHLKKIFEAFKDYNNQPNLLIQTIQKLNPNSYSSADNDNSDSTSPAGPIDDYSSAATPSGFLPESTESLKRELETVKKEKDAEIAELRAQLDRLKESIRGNTTAEVNQKPDTENTIDPDVLQMYLRAQQAHTDERRVTRPLAERTGFFPSDTDSEQGSVKSSRSTLRSEENSSDTDSPNPSPNRFADEDL